MFPIVELIGAHKEGTTSDFAELNVIDANAKFPFRVAHRRRAIAAPAGLVKHQRPVQVPELVD
jgi:hypothetical protein